MAATRRRCGGGTEEGRRVALLVMALLVMALLVMASLVMALLVIALLGMALLVMALLVMALFTEEGRRVEVLVVAEGGRVRPLERVGHDARCVSVAY